MDHLRIPGGEEHVRLAYIGTEEYDGGSFDNYPHRKNWKKADLQGDSSRRTRTEGEFNAFVQTWLFFGFLITFFRSVAVQVQTSDFIYTADDGKKYITTAKLPEFIQKWRTGPRRGGTWAGSKHQEEATLNSYLGRKVLSPVRQCLEDHHRYVEVYCGVGSSVFPDVAIAIVTLQWTLLYWAKGIGHSDWRLSHDFEIPDKAKKFLKDRLLKAHWCSSEITWIIREMHLDGQYYIGSLQCPRYEDDHSNCDAERHKCGYRNREWKYQTRHTTADCNCDYESAPGKTLDVIRNGGIPIMSWEDGKLNVVEFNPVKMRYVAISHVWSDGIGNEVANALPQCQLQRLQQFTEAVDYCRRHEPPPVPIKEMNALAISPSDSSSEDEPHLDNYADTILVGFWIDTLCVPLEPKELRVNQIGKMRNIYQEASCVLVLDHWVQAVTLTADIVERFSRLYLSNWQHRLWTCQEGVFAKTLYFQFQDGPQRLKDLMEEAGLRNDGPLESSIPALALNIPAFNEGKLEAYDIGAKVHPILEAVRTRTTTKKKDETVCIASLLGLDPSPILLMEVDSNRDICDQRMEALISMIETIPQGLIFNKFERLKTPGYRWAPRTFLGQALGPLLGNEMSDPELLAGEEGVFIHRQGLLVHFPAYLLSLSVEDVTTSMKISNSKKHFKVRLLDPDASTLRLRLQNHTPSPEPHPSAWKHRVWKHSDYVVRDEKYVLVVVSRESTNAIFCALDSLVWKDDGLPWPAHKLRYICPATLKRTKESPDKKDLVSFKFQKKWEWVIS